MLIVDAYMILLDAFCSWLVVFVQFIGDTGDFYPQINHYSISLHLNQPTESHRTLRSYEQLGSQQNKIICRLDCAEVTVVNTLENSWWSKCDAQNITDRRATVLMRLNKQIALA